MSRHAITALSCMLALGLAAIAQAAAAAELNGASQAGSARASDRDLSTQPQVKAAVHRIRDSARGLCGVKSGESDYYYYYVHRVCVDTMSDLWLARINGPSATGRGGNTSGALSLASAR